MNTTLKNLQTMVSEKNKAMSLEDVATQYKESRDPALFATAFCQLHRTATKLWHTKYTMFDEQDVVSWTLELVDLALTTYNPEKAKVNTYFYQIVSNRMRTEAQQLNTHKRKAVFNSSSFEKMVEDGFDVEVDTHTSTELEMTLNALELSEKELTYCLMASQNYTNTMIADALQVSAMTISNIRKKLKQKVTHATLLY